MRPHTLKHGAGPDAVEYLLSLGPAGLWIPPGPGGGDWLDLSGNRNDGTPQNTGDLTDAVSDAIPRTLGGWPETTVVIRFWILTGIGVALGLGLFYADFLRVGGLL